MTMPDDSGLTCVYDLIPFALEGDIKEKRAFRGLADTSGAWWAFGDRTLLFSLNGVQWTDVTDCLDLPEAFSVSTVVGDESGAFVFVRSKDGLLCFHLVRNGWTCTRLPSLPTPSPGALVQRINGALLACVTDGRGTQFMRFRDSDVEWAQIPGSIPGTAVHFEMDDSGVGICALWGIEREGDLAQPSPSAVFRTQDGGISWSKVHEMDTMLLVGASGHDGTTLLGGTDGYIAERTSECFQDCRQHSTDEVAALSSGFSQQAAVLASLDEHPRQVLLWRSKSPEWSRLNVGLVERIISLRMLRFGVVLLCTQRSLFTFKLELVQ